MNFEQYQAIPAINASAIKRGLISMKHMRSAMTDKDDADSPSLRWGRLFHKSILENAEFNALVSVFKGDKRTKEWKEFKADHEPEWIVTSDELSALTAMRDSVMQNPDAARLIDGMVNELVVEWSGEFYGAAKARLDGWHEKKGVLELKTTRVIPPKAFAGQFAKLSYDISAGWYSEGVRLAGLCNDLPAYTVLAVENVKPFDCAVYTIPRMVIEIGLKRARKIAEEYRLCEKAGRWPGVCDGVQELEMPSWWGEDEIMEGFFESAKEQLGMGEEI